jgi:dolichyl-phosphate beta-glucosyltransferase
MPKSPKATDLTIVVPALHEERRLGKTLESLALYLGSEPILQGKHVEVVLVVADTTDKTLEIAEEKSRLFSTYQIVQPGPRYGKGRDVRAGMQVAHGACVMFMDADMATPLWHIGQFYQICSSGVAVVVGARDLRRYRHDFLRVFISAAGNVLFRVAGGVWLEDSQCGFKMFSARASKLCFEHLNILGWGFDMEVLAAARANHLPIQKVQLSDYKDMPYSTFDDKLVRNSFNALGDLGMIFLRRMSGYYRRRVKRQKGKAREEFLARSTEKA